MKKLLVILSSVICFSTLSGQIDYKGLPEWSWHKQDSTEYYLYTPAEKSPDSLYPIALFLHGCCGTSYEATLRNTVDPPVRMWHNFGANTQHVPTYIVAPATARGWNQHIPALKKVLDDLIANHNGDPQRIYISGFSMGGAGTWEFLQRYPNYFAAAIPMGMNFHGDHSKVKDIPIWTHRGETDYWARTLHTDVGKIRTLHGDVPDSSRNWVTGVNPRFTSFAGHDHGVQWIAASSSDLPQWALTKRNDGNKYPVVFFQTPVYNQKVNKGSLVDLHIYATDADGIISKVIVDVNGRNVGTLTKPPFRMSIRAVEGDMHIQATAIDDKGKSNTAGTIVKTDIKPRMVTLLQLPDAVQGALYEKLLFATGNGDIRFTYDSMKVAGAGFQLTADGRLSGVPAKAGHFQFPVIARDEDGDTVSTIFQLTVSKKLADEIVVTNVKNDSGLVFPVSKMRRGANTHFNRSDDEVSVSNAGAYAGMTYIPGNSSDTARSAIDYLSFEVDENATVYIAYEKKDHLFVSTVPEWLKTFRKEPSSQITAQYYYFDLYYKDFPKGRIVLPGADEKRNNVSNNYFVLVRKQNEPYQFPLAISTQTLPEAVAGQKYLEQLTALHGTGMRSWKMISGKLPKNLVLNNDGMLVGYPWQKGRFVFTVHVQDESGTESQKTLDLMVK